MTNIQKKSLKHVSNTLESFNSHPVYSALINALIDAGIDNHVRSKIADKYQEALSEQTQKITEAKSWVDTIISDI